MYIQVNKQTFSNLDNITNVYVEHATPYGDKMRITFESCGDTVCTQPMSPQEAYESLLRLKIILEDNYGVADQWLFKSTAENTDTQSKK